jgi:hypothetical protein
MDIILSYVSYEVRSREIEAVQSTRTYHHTQYFVGLCFDKLEISG